MKCVLIRCIFKILTALRCYHPCCPICFFFHIADFLYTVYRVIIPTAFNCKFTESNKRDLSKYVR